MKNSISGQEGSCLTGLRFANGKERNCYFVLYDHIYASEKRPCAASIDKNQVIFSMANEIT